MRVECEVEYVDLEGDYGDVEGVRVTCGRCGHSEESFGTSGASIRRCCALLRENCPEDEQNHYIPDDEGQG